MQTGGRPPRRIAAEALDNGFFVLSGVAGAWFAYVLLRDGARPGWSLVLLLVFWVFFAYLVLPRLHRILTGVYLPGYFVGRTRTSDGLLGDPVNVALLGGEAQVHAALTGAGWTCADELGARTGWRIVASTLRRRSYPAAPVSPLQLFERRQDFAYQREVAGNPAQRHHVRFWRCPDEWLLPGGFRADWMAAATYDRSIGLSLFTLQVTHRIDADTDVERDFVVSSITGNHPDAEVSVINNFSSGYHHRNGGGDHILTDGHLPVVDLRSIDAADAPVVSPSASPRPLPVLVGSAIALLRAPAYLVSAAPLLMGDDPAGMDVVAGAVLLTAALVDGGLALAVLARQNWARLCLMLACSVTALSAMIAMANGRSRPVGSDELLVVGGSILVLLTLSSRVAHDWTARRNRKADQVAAPRSSQRTTTT